MIIDNGINEETILHVWNWSFKTIKENIILQKTPKSNNAIVLPLIRISGSNGFVGKKNNPCINHINILAFPKRTRTLVCIR